MAHTAPRVEGAPPAATGRDPPGTAGPPATPVSEADAKRLPAPPHPLLATKLHLPPARPTLFPRPQLFARLQAGLLGKLTLIAAPAGFGKTSLLSAWRATPAGSTLRWAWLSLDAADSDPTRFWSYVIAALGSLQPDREHPALALLHAPQPPPVETVLTPLLNSLSTLPADAVLVLDDYHLIDAPPIHRGLAFLLDHLPPQVHLVLLTRADPPLPLARLRAQGSLSELRAADLRFTAEETAAFLTGLPLSVEDIATLEARTEGWIAGLQFAALAMRDRADLSGFVQAFRGSNRFVVDYLAEEVLARQPPHLQAFLLQTSILDRMCGPLCDAVLLGPDEVPHAGRPLDTLPLEPPVPAAYSQSLLAELERANLFLVSLDDERHWYRYHHLFGELLRQRLASGAAPTVVATLHRRASAWFERQDLGVEAIEHALAAQDWAQAARLIEQHVWTVMFRGQIFTMLDWFRTLPAAVMDVRPTLYVLQAVMLMHTRQLDAAEARLRTAEACLRPETPADLRLLVQGMVQTTRATIGFYQGDLPRCVTHARQALTLLPEMASIPHTAARGFAALSFLVSGELGPAVEHQLAEVASVARTADNRYVVLRVIILRARLQMLQGRLRAAAATLRQAAEVAPENGGVQRLIGSEGYYFGLGDLYREWNDLGTAEGLLRTGMERALGEWTTNATLLGQGVIALARLQQAVGDPAGADATLERFAALGQEHAFDPLVLARAAALRAQLALGRGALDMAERWARASGLGIDDEPAFLREAEYLALARVLIARGRTSVPEQIPAALQLLERLRAAAEAGERTGSIIEILSLQALALQAGGDAPAARDALARALALAEPEGYVRLFVDEGSPMAALLETYATMHAGDGAPHQHYANRLLAAFDAPPMHAAERMQPATSATALSPAALGLAPLVEPLSARELEILRLIAGGHSNQAIADALIIALGTVKKHINNIYGKLAVQSRTQALARARQLGLL
ncbi:MAG: helix-turn-helix transcriptional regulator [Chloroflexales bacterium]|nr:helix-turn-helix transcriptional regulator [Chloroflexales bacterium]